MRKFVVLLFLVICMGGCDVRKNEAEKSAEELQSLEEVPQTDSFDSDGGKTEDHMAWSEDAAIKTMEYHVSGEAEMMVTCYERSEAPGGISVLVRQKTGDDWQEVDSAFQYSTEYWTRIPRIPRDMKDGKCLDAMIVSREKRDKLRLIFEKDAEQNLILCMDVVWTKDGWLIDSATVQEGPCFWQMPEYIDPEDMQFPDWEEAYQWLLDEWKGLSAQKKVVMGLRDLNADQVPEFIVTDQLDNLHVFAYQDGRLRQIDEWSLDGNIYAWGDVIASGRNLEMGGDCRFLRYVDGEYRFGLCDRYSSYSTKVDYNFIDRFDEERSSQIFDEMFPLYLPELREEINMGAGKAWEEMLAQWKSERGEFIFGDVLNIEDLEDLTQYHKLFGIEIYEREIREDELICRYQSGRVRQTIFANVFIEDQDTGLSQQLDYRLWHPSAATLYWGNGEQKYEILLSDVNEDGHKDIWISLGWDERTKAYGCFIYDPLEKQYLRLNGFEKIVEPKVVPGGIRLRDTHTFFPSIEKYKIVQTDGEYHLECVGVLFQEPEPQHGASWDGETVARYTEYHYYNGKVNYSRENITLEKIDWKFWNYDVQDLVEGRFGL